MTNQTSEVLQRLEKSLDDYTDAVHEHRKNIHEKDYKKCEVCQSKRQDILGQLRTALKDTERLDFLSDPNHRPEHFSGPRPYWVVYGTTQSVTEQTLRAAIDAVMTPTTGTKE